MNNWIKINWTLGESHETLKESGEIELEIDILLEPNRWKGSIGELSHTLDNQNPRKWRKKPWNPSIALRVLERKLEKKTCGNLNEWEGIG